MSDGSTVHAERPAAACRESGGGRTVVCLHGWGASAELFEPFRRDLGEGFHVVAPDFPGFGDTPEPSEPWSVDDYVDWTVALLDRLGIDRADIVAHSFGARVALKLAVAQPQRIRHMVLTGAAGIRPRRGIGYHARVRTFKLARRATAMAWLPASLRRRAERRVAASGSRDYRSSSGVMRGTFVRVVNEDLGHLLGKVAVPTLLVWGDADDETPPADGRLMERLMPDAGLVVFAGRGHYAYIDESARFATIVRTFLLGSEAG